MTFRPGITQWEADYWRQLAREWRQGPQANLDAAARCEECAFQCEQRCLPHWHNNGTRDWDL